MPSALSFRFQAGLVVKDQEKLSRYAHYFIFGAGSAKSTIILSGRN